MDRPHRRRELEVWLRSGGAARGTMPDATVRIVVNTVRLVLGS